MHNTTSDLRAELEGLYEHRTAEPARIAAAIEAADAGIRASERDAMHEEVVRQSFLCCTLHSSVACGVC